MKRIYVESDDLAPLIDWLKTKPEGMCKVLIGGDANAVAKVMKATTAEGRDFAACVVVKIQAGELELKSMKEKAPIPIGEVFEG